MPVERLDVQSTADFLQLALHQARYDFAIDRIPSTASVLEIGTGAGGMSVMLQKKCSNYTGVEFDDGAIKITQKKLGFDAKLLKADARNLPFAPQSFSHIVCLEVLEHLGDFRAGVREIYRCLRADGRAIISVPFREHGGKSFINPYHPYEPGEQELYQTFLDIFARVHLYSQYFEESALMTWARRLHLRRLLGLADRYRALTEGRPEAVGRLRIDTDAKGMKICVILVAMKGSEANEVRQLGFEGSKW